MKAPLNCEGLSNFMAKQTPGSKCDTGSKYELSVTALVASFLSKNKNVENYRIFSNIGEAQPFDDIIAEVQFKTLKQTQTYAIQVKSGNDKLNINKYLDGYEKIMKNGGLKFGTGIRNKRIHYWYFCNKNPTKKVFPMTTSGNTIDLKLKLRNGPYNVDETILGKALAHELFSEDLVVTDYPNFFDSFYLYLNQPDTQKIIYIVKGMWNIDNPWLILLYLDNYFGKSTDGLDKTMFEHELLKISLSNYIVTPTRAIAFKHKAVKAWNRLTLEQDVTIIHDQLHVEQNLFGCILQNISDVISIDKWNDLVENGGKLDRDIKEAFKTKSLRPETLRDLIVQAWIDGKTPLLLRVEAPLPLLKEFYHLRKSYVIIDTNVGRRYEEINSYKLSVFTHLGDVKADELMADISVSLQGRKPVSLYIIFNGDKMLMEAITCLDVINLVRPRTAYLKQECLDGNSYMLFIIEIPDIQQRSNDEHQPIGNNITIYCGSEQSYECYKKIREDPKFRSYEVFRLRLIDDSKLVLIPRSQELGAIQREQESHGLECFFFDQSEESVYNIENGDPIPIIGEVPNHIWMRYVPRYLREGVKEDRNNSLSEDHKFTVQYNGKRIPEKNFFEESNGPITVITGEPGIGKTTLLRSLFRLCESRYYVLFVDLARYQADLHERNPKLFQNPLQFLRDKHDSLPYNRLSRSLFGNCTRLILLLDSFDEVTATCEQQVLELIQSLQKVGLQKIVIASRLTVANLIIDKFEAEVFKIENFHGQSDEPYINNWNLNISSLRHIPPEFLTNPLYLNMLRTIFENEINLEVVNRWSLYESIIGLKMKNYCQRMKPHCLDENEKQNILSHHWYLALKIVFGSYTVVQELQQKSHPKHSNFTRLGFINCYDENEDPIFVHHTFAEFFVVQWLIENIDHEKAEYVYKLILESKGNLLDMYSENFPLHKAVLYGSDVAVEKLCTQNSRCLLETDDLGRNALHLAAIIYNRGFSQKSNRLNLLLQRMRKEGYDLYIRDKIMKWTWVDYWEDYVFINNLWNDEHIVILEAHLNYYAIYLVEMLSSSHRFPFKDDFNRLFNIAIKYSSIGMIQDLLLLKYYINETFLEFRDMCLQSRVITSKTFLDLLLHDENLRDAENLTPLLVAIDTANMDLDGAHSPSRLEMIRVLLEHKANVNDIPAIRYTPLDLATMYGNNDIIEILLKYNAYAKLEDTSSGRPLYNAINTGNKETIELLLRNGVPVNCMDADGLTPLIYAIKIRNKDIIRILLNYKADVNFENKFGQTPLYWSIETGSKKIVELLLESGANVNCVDPDGLTPLVWAVARKNSGQKLFNQISYTNFKVEEGMGNIREAVEIIKLLLRNGANVNYSDLNGLTPLTHAIVVGDKETIELLLIYNVDVNRRDKFNRAPLHKAIETRNTEIIEMLLKNGADVNISNPPLTYAVKTGNNNIVQMLLNYNAQVNLRDEDDRTCLHAAVEESTKEIIELLLRNGAEVDCFDFNYATPLVCAILRQWKDIVAMLLNHITDVNIKDADGRTHLYWAIAVENIEIIELLLRDGADVNCSDLNDITPLVVAIMADNKKIVSMLLNYNVNVDAEDKYGQTPLTLAIRNKPRNTDVADALIENGASVNCTDKFGFTPLIVAVENGMFKIARSLLDNGANVNFQNECGISALYIAALKNHVIMVELLLERGADANILRAEKTFRNVISVENIGILARLLKIRATIIYLPPGKAMNIIQMVTQNWNNINLEKELRTLVTEESLLTANTMNLLRDWGGGANFCDKFWIVILRLIEEMNDKNIDDVFTRFIFDCPLEDRVAKLCRAMTEERNLDLLKIFLRNGLSADSINRKTHLTLLQTAVNLNDRDYVQILLQNHADVNFRMTKVNSLHKAVYHQNIDIVKLLLEHNFDVNVEGPQILTPLQIAVELRDTEFVQLLLHHGTNVNQAGIVCTPLQIAVERNNEEIVQILLQFGADVNSGSNSNTPLCTAIRERNTNIIKMLIQQNGDVNRVDEHGFTPLMRAVATEDPATVEMLLCNGADVNIEGQSGLTALYIAARAGNRCLVSTLLKYGANEDIEINEEKLIDE
ncbi:hypothetical protein Trydic_g20640, partial [Trypoxylus dichotomus]